MTESMPSGDERSRENSPTSGPVSRASSRGSSKGSGSRRPPGPANVIEFVDSQDPNVKSAIQRHTAYHSAAQRREARLRSLRRGNHSRYLEWGRRPVSEPPASSTITRRHSSSTPRPPASLTTSQSHPSIEIPTNLLEPPPSQSAPGSRSISPQVTISAEDELVIETYLRNICPQSRPDYLQSVIISFIRTDEACTQLLIAYCSAISASRQQSRAAAEPYLQSAQRYLGRGTNLLWNRLRDPLHASSDVNIQAVLLLVAYTSDFGEGNEVDIHADALRTMVAQRRGAAAIDNGILRNQLTSMDSTRKFHLTLTFAHDCGAPMRFPGGFWPR